MPVMMNDEQLYMVFCPLLLQTFNTISELAVYTAKASSYSV